MGKALTVKEFVANVISWGNRTQILSHGTWLGQAAKLLEETGEMSGALARRNIAKALDAFGDQCFLMVMLAKLLGRDPVEILNADRTYIASMDAPNYHKATVALMMYNGFMSRAVISALHAGQGEGMIYASTLLNNAYRELFSIAECCGFTPEEAMGSVWDIVKDRKGRLTSGGVFIKATDIEYYAPTRTVSEARFTEDVSSNIVAGRASILTTPLHPGGDYPEGDNIPNYWLTMDTTRTDPVFRRGRDTIDEAAGIDSAVIYVRNDTKWLVLEWIRSQFEAGNPFLNGFNSFEVVEIV